MMCKKKFFFFSSKAGIDKSLTPLEFYVANHNQTKKGTKRNRLSR